MPLFASFDSVYTRPASETPPEFAESLYDGVSSDDVFTNFRLADREALDIHDELIGFEISAIPGMIQGVEPGSYSPINPIEYIPGIDPVTQMVLAMEQGDAWAMEAAGSYGTGHPTDHMYDVHDWSDPTGDRYHKHDPSTGTTTTTTIHADGSVTTEVWNENGLVSSTTTPAENSSSSSDSSSDSTDSSNSGDAKWWQFRKKMKENRDENDITPESEGGGANIAAMDLMIHDVYTQEMFGDLFDQNVIGESIFQNHLLGIDAFSAEGMTPQSALESNFIRMDMSNYFM